MFSHRHQRARLCVVPYHDSKRPHLKWTIAGYYVNGKRVRRFFSAKPEAETFVRQLRVKAQNLGERATHVDPRLHVMAIEAQDRLDRYGTTIADAARFYQQHLESVARSCSVGELVAEFLQNKKADGKSGNYLYDLRNRLKRFELAFGDRVIATVTTTECDDWLRQLRLAPQSRNNYRRVLGTFFGYAASRGFCPENPVTKTAKAKVTAKPAEVLTPEQLRRLLLSADADVLPYLAVGAFAGLRPAELARLDWRNVRLEREFIEVAALVSKTASRRLVTILPNLKEWIKPHRRLEGDLAPQNLRKKIDAARARARIERWPTNGLRHSFASYHLAKFQNAPALALQMGHTTTAMLFAHYREVVSPEDAEEYWNIVPPSGDGEVLE